MLETRTEITVFPRGTYKDFHLIEVSGLLYAVPPFLGFHKRLDPEIITWHPAILSALTREELETQIDSYDPTPFLGERLGEANGYQFLRFRDRVYAIPLDLGLLDLNQDQHRHRPEVVSGRTREEVEELLRARSASVPIEFAGWMPIYKTAGDCGKHPQFKHTATPPDGYRFVQTPPASLDSDALPPRRWFNPFAWLAGLLRAVTLPVTPFLAVFRNMVRYGPIPCLVMLAVVLRLAWRFVCRGLGVLPTVRFLRSRHFRSQVMLPRSSELLFVTSIPFTYGQSPWVIEIEDTNSLFHPFIKNGDTAELDFQRCPYFWMVRDLLEADNCRGILTHIRSTARSLPVLFQSEIIARKVTYLPLGVPSPPRWQTHSQEGPIDLLFTNSFHQQAAGFFLRGGLDVLEAFALLKERYPQLRLTLRSSLPLGLAPRHSQIIEKSWVRVINRFLPADELDELFQATHIYLLPAARIHIVSLLQAMSYGQVVVASDGWGIQEYLTHERNGLIVPGRYGKTSWLDEENGALREDYRPMMRPCPEMVTGLVEAISRLVEDPRLRSRLGRNARGDIESTYNLAQWNQELKAALDRARSRP